MLWEGGTYAGNYDLHPDGKRLLVRKTKEGEAEPEFDGIILFENFTDYLQETVSTE